MRPVGVVDARQARRAAACRRFMATPGMMQTPAYQRAVNRALRRSERQAARQALRSMMSRPGAAE